MTATARMSQLGMAPTVGGGKVVCFHHAGGSAAEFRSWSGGLGPRISLQAAGPRRSDPQESIPRLAASVAEQVMCSVASGREPVVLFGLSFGGLCAFEVARQLEQAHLSNPIHVIVASARPPGPEQWSTNSNCYDDASLRTFLQSLGGTPASHLEHADLIEAVIPLLRKDLQLIDDYRRLDPGSVTCPITYLGGAEDRRVPPAAMHGWRGVTTGAFKAEFFAGGHFFLRDHQRAVVARIRTTVENLRGAS